MQECPLPEHIILYSPLRLLLDLELARDEEEALAGKKGETLASAYRILAAIGEATGATKLVPIKWAHVSGVNYSTIGDAGVQFLDKFRGLPGRS